MAELVGVHSEWMVFVRRELRYYPWVLPVAVSEVMDEQIVVAAVDRTIVRRYLKV
jgi:hypothetical protein